MRKNKRCQHRQFSTPHAVRVSRLFEREAFGKSARDSSMTRNKRIGGNPVFLSLIRNRLLPPKTGPKAGLGVKWNYVIRYVITMKYLIILLVYLFVTFAIHKLTGVKLWNNAREKRATIWWFAIIFVTGMMADYYSSVMNSIWVFPGNGRIGVKIFSLPLEEYIFFLVIPYFVLVLYKALNKLFLK